jgi:hypothetical protein
MQYNQMGSVEKNICSIYDALKIPDILNKRTYLVLMVISRWIDEYEAHNNVTAELERLKQ